MSVHPLLWETIGHALLRRFGVYAARLGAQYPDLLTTSRMHHTSAFPLRTHLSLRRTNAAPWIDISVDVFGTEPTIEVRMDVAYENGDLLAERAPIPVPTTACDVAELTQILDTAVAAFLDQYESIIADALQKSGADS